MKIDIRDPMLRPQLWMQFYTARIRGNQMGCNLSASSLANSADEDLAAFLKRFPDDIGVYGTRDVR